MAGTFPHFMALGIQWRIQTLHLGGWGGGGACNETECQGNCRGSFGERKLIYNKIIIAKFRGGGAQGPRSTSGIMS